MAERVRNLRLEVKIRDHQTILLVTQEAHATGEVTDIRISEMSPSVALKLGYHLQNASEELLRQHGENVERIGGRQCRDVKSTGA